MTTPTVNDALAYADTLDPETIDRGSSLQELFLVLAAEVKRLRNELRLAIGEEALRCDQ